MTQWRLLNTGYASGAWNMALDEALLQSVICGDAPTTLRFYGWKPAGVSLGYFQGIEGLDLPRIAELGFGLVRRPTGGRAILHDHEVTYSVCIRQDALDNGGSVMGSYRELSRGLEAGLRLLGLEAGLAPKASAQRGQDGVLNANCFAKATAGDLVAAGRKIIGSAQTRRQGAILQHGSVPIGIDFSTQKSIMPSGHEAQLQEAACGLADLLGRPLSFEELADALAEGFSHAFEQELQPAEPTAEELQRACNLVEERYGTDTWNLNPPAKR